MFSGCWSLVAIVCAVPVVAAVVMVIAMGTVMVVTVMMMVLNTAVVSMSVVLAIGIGLTFKTNSSLNFGLGLLMSAVEKYLFDSSRKLCRLRCCCIRTYRVWTHCVLHHSSNKLIHSNFAIMIHIQSLKQRFGLFLGLVSRLFMIWIILSHCHKDFCHFLLFDAHASVQVHC